MAQANCPPVPYLSNLLSSPPPKSLEWDLVIRWISTDCAVAIHTFLSRYLMRKVFLGWRDLLPPGLVMSSDDEPPVHSPTDSASSTSSNSRGGNSTANRQVGGLMMIAR